MPAATDRHRCTAPTPKRSSPATTAYVVGSDTGETYGDLLARAGRASVEVITGPGRGLRRTLNSARFLMRFARDV